MTDYYCDCEAPCIHKGGLQKIRIYENGKVSKKKVQKCKNKAFSTCAYRKNIFGAFKF